MSVFRAGFALGIGLIISIGPQNLFLIRQGILRQYALVAAILCIICDSILILLAGNGVGMLVLNHPILKTLMFALGTLFLCIYGGQSFYRGYKRATNQEKINMDTENTANQLLPVIIASLFFSILNPNALIDTFVMIGSTVSKYPTDLQNQFLAGAILASVVWFSSITAASTLLSAHLSKKGVWIALDFISGLIMCGFGFSLLWTLVANT